jgi:hypothetical protein
MGKQGGVGHHLNWMTADEHLEKVAKRLGEIQTTPILTKAMIARLSLLDKRSYDAGLFGANPAGLYEPRPKAKEERRYLARSKGGFGKCSI